MYFQISDKLLYVFDLNQHLLIGLSNLISHYQIQLQPNHYCKFAFENYTIIQSVNIKIFLIQYKQGDKLNLIKMFNENNTTVICIDVQEKLVNMLQNSAQIAENTTKIMKAASLLNIDAIITEQYPKGLGSTIESIKNLKEFTIVEKNTFSAMQTSEFNNKFDNLKNKNILIFGIETHICVLQSVIDLIEKNYNVFVIEDCSSSRDKNNHNIALDFMKQRGAYIITLEIALFDLLKSSKHPNFKEIQQLIK